MGRSHAWVVVGVVGAMALGGGPLGAAAPPRAPSELQIAALVRQLGALKPGVRQRAERGLQLLGRRALAALYAAADDADPRVREGARGLIERSVACVFDLQQKRVRVHTSGKGRHSPIVRVDFYGAAPSDADVELLRGLPHLANLNVNYGERLTDRCLPAVGSLTSLSRLDVCGGRFTDQGLRNLRGLKGLTFLRFSRSLVSGEGLACLPRPDRLDALHLASCRVTDRGMKVIERFANLRVLGVGGPALSDEGMRSLRRLPGLVVLLVLEDARLTDRALEHVRQLKRLQVLALTGNFTRAKTDELRRSLPGLNVSVFNAPHRRP